MKMTQETMPFFPPHSETLRKREQGLEKIRGLETLKMVSNDIDGLLL